MGYGRFEDRMERMCSYKQKHNSAVHTDAAGIAALEVQIGGKWINLAEYEGSLEGLDAQKDFRVSFELNLGLGDDSGEKLLTITREFVLHGSTNTELLAKAINDPTYSLNNLRNDYKQSLLNEDDHLQVTPGSNTLYEKVNDDVNTTLLKNKELNSFIKDPNFKGSGGKNKKLVNLYKTKLGTIEYTANLNGLYSIRQSFNFNRSFEKTHKFNPDKRGFLLNALKPKTTTKMDKKRKND